MKRLDKPWQKPGRQLKRRSRKVTKKVAAYRELKLNSSFFIFLVAAIFFMIIGAKRNKRKLTTFGLALVSYLVCMTIIGLSWKVMVTRTSPNVAIVTIILLSTVVSIFYIWLFFQFTK